MPAITSGKVLVSGANGFIAAWVVRVLLEQGFSVRGTVRSADKCAPLREIFASYGDKFELVVVPDITQEGAFDEAVKGVDAIEHTASPFHLQVDDPDVRHDKPPACTEFIRPAIHGTLGILQSAAKYGTSVKRVVITSSCAAVLQIQAEPRTFSELDWNEQAPREVTEMGRSAPAMTKYRASKTLAERAAWDFVAKHKTEIGWDLIAINPPPQPTTPPTPAHLGTSARQFYTMLTQPSPSATLGTGSCWIDVRDLGRAHVLALLREEAAGERIILSAGPFVWQDWLDAAPDSPKFQKGVPGGGKDSVHLIRYDTAKAAHLLEMEYRTMEETARDTVADWEARGWL
ncbi:Ketoreductase azaE [Mycena sanguinolenta]|uniref:Ketoreductase azaE n=1 Tax=Mycena sanguinolenta TaxID=230812 RepID=A0A8H6ZGG1_9AGAR|nr:Ketoreductase azaE [Mycena sanguinolenta]